MVMPSDGVMIMMHDDDDDDDESIAMMNGLDNS